MQEHALAEPDRIEVLDTFRGVGALSVALFWHYLHFGAPPDFFSWPVVEVIRKYGWLGVDLFFLLSGYIFAHKYLDKISKGYISGYEFFVLRVSRLAPLHYATTVIVGIFAWMFFLLFQRWPIYGANDAYHLALNFLFAHHLGLQQAFSFNAPSWSLCQEMLCYLIFFVIAREMPRYFWAIAFALALFGVHLIIQNPHNLFVLNHETGRALAGFFVGCLLSAASTSPARKQLMFIAAGLLAFFAISYAWRRHAAFPWKLDNSSLNVMCTLVLFPCVIYLGLHWRHLQRLLTFPPAVYIGEISYSIYLVHVPVQLLLMNAAALAGMTIPASSPWFWVAYSSIVLGVSAATYHYFEMPMRRQLRQQWLRDRAPSDGEAGTVRPQTIATAGRARS